MADFGLHGVMYIYIHGSIITTAPMHQVMYLCLYVNCDLQVYYCCSLGFKFTERLQPSVLLIIVLLIIGNLCILDGLWDYCTLLITSQPGAVYFTSTDQYVGAS